MLVETVQQNVESVLKRLLWRICTVDETFDFKSPVALQPCLFGDSQTLFGEDNRTVEFSSNKRFQTKWLYCQMCSDSDGLRALQAVVTSD